MGTKASPGAAVLRVLLQATFGGLSSLSVEKIESMNQQQAKAEFKRVLSVTLAGCLPGAKALDRTLHDQWLSPQPLLAALWKKTGWDELLQATTGDRMLVVARPPPGVGASDDLMLGLNINAVIKQGTDALLRLCDTLWPDSVAVGSDAWASGQLARAIVASTALALTEQGAEPVPDCELFTMSLEQADAKLQLAAQQAQLPAAHATAMQAVHAGWALLQMQHGRVRLDVSALMAAAQEQSAQGSGSGMGGMAKAAGQMPAAPALSDEDRRRTGGPAGPPCNGRGVNGMGGDKTVGSASGCYMVNPSAPAPVAAPAAVPAGATKTPSAEALHAHSHPYVGPSNNLPPGHPLSLLMGASEGARPMAHPNASPFAGQAVPPAAPMAFPFPGHSPSPQPAPPVYNSPPSSMANEGSAGFLDLFHAHLQQALPQLAATAPGAGHAPLPAHQPPQLMHSHSGQVGPSGTHGLGNGSSLGHAASSPLPVHSSAFGPGPHMPVPPTLHAAHQVQQLRHDLISAAQQLWAPAADPAGYSEYLTRYLQQTMACMIVDDVCGRVVEHLREVGEAPSWPSPEAQHQAIGQVLAEASDLLLLQPHLFMAPNHGPFPAALEVCFKDMHHGAVPTESDYKEAEALLMAQREPLLTMDASGQVMLDARGMLDRAHYGLGYQRASPACGSDAGSLNDGCHLQQHQLADNVGSAPGAARLGAVKPPPPGFVGGTPSNSNPSSQSSVNPTTAGFISGFDARSGNGMVQGRSSHEYSNSSSQLPAPCDALSEPVTRHSSFAGNGTPGAQAAKARSPDAPTPGKYVPPCRRKQMAAEAGGTPAAAGTPTTRADGAPSWRTGADMMMLGMRLPIAKPVLAAGPPA